MILNRYINKLSKKIITKNKLSKKSYVYVDFIRFYLVFNLFNEEDNHKQFKAKLTKIYKDTNWLEICEWLINQDKPLNLEFEHLYLVFLDSLKDYYAIGNISYFFAKEFNDSDFQNKTNAYNQYLIKNDIFIEELKRTLPTKFGTIYNYIKKNKKGV